MTHGPSAGNAPLSASLDAKRLRVLPILERWDCHTCGVCCKGHTVLLDDDDLARLESQRWQDRPEFANSPVVMKVEAFSKRKAVAQRPDGTCVFLTADNRCRIHAEFGEPAKPWACRMFPYQVIPAGDHFRVTMRRTCPSAAADKGRPLAEQLQSVAELAPKAVPALDYPPPAVSFRDRRSWPETNLLLERLQELVLDPAAPLVLRLVRGLRFVNLLAETRSDKLDAEKWRDLLVVASDNAMREAAEAFAARQEPGKAAKMLFRQVAAEYMRFHPNLGDRPTWRQRFNLFWAALAIAGGSGKLPRIHPDLPEATFEELERPLGPLPFDALQPIARYFEALVASLQYCGAGRRGWSVVDGFRAAALAFPVAMWALRWLSAGAPPTNAAAVQTVVILDRSHYYPLLLGYRHRKRLDALATLGDFEKLLIWYAR